MAESSSSAEVRSQYHHFIPRFILRNFSHKEEVQNISKKSRKKGKGKGKKSVPRPRAPEDMVNAIDLSGPEAQIIETTVARTFGLVDMYRDFDHAKQHHIEEQLSVLEARAGQIISTIRKDFEAGKPDVWLTRGQRDTLRKFLFIMKYRGTRAHRRFYHEDAAEYNSDDKERLTKYMKEKGFQKPMDVWFDNIQAILNLKMDADLEWMEKLTEQIYPDDARWFIMHTQQFYLAICTPSAENDEFLLTQNAYSIHEGPVSQSMNLMTGEYTNGVYTEFHLFAPIAPKLIFVLRSFMLPCPIEDNNSNLRMVKETYFQASKARHHYPEIFDSLLKDLPITKALNSYSKIIDGRIIPINGGPKGATDKFCFQYFPIETEHVDKINSIMLEESHKISAIVFKSKARTQQTLETYLRKTDQFGRFDPVGDPLRSDCIRKLRQAHKLLGGVCSDDERPSSPRREFTLPHRPQLQTVDKVFDLFKRSKETTELYTELSGHSLLDSNDFDQARDIFYLRIKLDSTSRGESHETKEDRRNKFLGIYNRLPIQVVWIYLKRIRFMKLGGTSIGISNEIQDSWLSADELEGSEDDVARMRTIFRKEDLPRIMHYASVNEFIMRKPEYGLAGDFMSDDNGGQRLSEEKYLVLGPQGSIGACSIPELEPRANQLLQSIRAGRLAERPKSPFDIMFDEDEKIELWTRELLRPEFKDIMAGKLPEDELQTLEKIIFDIVYPLFGPREVERVDEGQDSEKCSVQ